MGAQRDLVTTSFRSCSSVGMTENGGSLPLFTSCTTSSSDDGCSVSPSESVIRHRSNGTAGPSGDGDPVRNHVSAPQEPIGVPASMAVKLSRYITSVRPWSFTASITPALLGFVLAYTYNGEWRVLQVIFGLITVICVHAAGNVVNTYFDYMRGFDKDSSDDRTLVDRVLAPDEVVNLGAALYVVGVIGFFLLVAVSPAKIFQLALIFFGGLSGSFLYTGGSGFKYLACGDLLIFTVFGPLTTLFCYMAACGQFSWTPCLYSVPLALSIVAILHCNNTRDVQTDREGGSVTLAMLLGNTGSYVFYVVLLYLPYLILAVLAVRQSRSFVFPLFTLPAAFTLAREMRAALMHATELRNQSLAKMPQRTAKMNACFGVLFLVSCLTENCLS